MPELNILEKITDVSALEALLASEPTGTSRRIDLNAMTAHLRSRVKGQDEVIRDFALGIRNFWAMEHRTRPIANFILLGPPGVGKTQLARATAEYLYGSEDALLEFRGPEFGREGKNRLIGNPRGYVGSTNGGILTRPVINNPRRVIVFDEIDKCDKEVLDLFLHMLDEGLLTEQGTEQQANFRQCIILFTSNGEEEAIGRLQTEISDSDQLLNAVKLHLVTTGQFRAEIMSRIDRVYAFRPAAGMTVAEIAAMKMVAVARQYGLTLEYVSPELIFKAMQRGNKLSRFGVRDLGNVIVDMFAAHFIAAKEAGAKDVRLEIEDDGAMAICPATQRLP